jgi:hypothetical protein
MKVKTLSLPTPVAFALACLAGLVVAAAAASAHPANGSAAAKPKVFAPGKWVGAGAYSAVDRSGPIDIAYSYKLAFTMTVSPGGAVAGHYRLVGVGRPVSGGFTGTLRTVIDAKPTGSAADVVLVGHMSTGGVLTRGKVSVPITSNRSYRARLAVTLTSCLVARGPKWVARRTARSGKPPAPAALRAAENNLLDDLEDALDRRPAKPSAYHLRLILKGIQDLHFKIAASRTCGVAPAGYANGVAGRAVVVELFAEVIKHMTSPGRPSVDPTYTATDIAGLVNAAVDAGLVGPGARNADPAVRGGLETALNDALSTVHGRAGMEAVVADIRRAAERAGMPAIAERAAKR